MKKDRQFVNLISWLALTDVFQTFDDLESVTDKRADVQNIRQLLDDEADHSQEKLY